ncbi:MAG: cytochrome c biogenesis protein ResB [Candidatus Sulfobium sp.]|jgi:cytochrome c biogenesis protein
MEKTKHKTLTDKIWGLFASVKFAVVIFSLIALTSIVGTVIEQNAEPAKNIKILAKFFGQSGAPAAYSVFDKLGFMDMYHSWWFITFLLLFAANLIICSLDRIPRIWKIVREPIRPLSPDHVGRMSIKKTVTLKAKPAHAKDLATKAFRKIGFRPSESSSEQGVQLYAEKGNFTRLGVYITHCSILIILAGAIIGVAFGFNAFLALPEGQTSSFAYQTGNRRVLLGFEVRCDKFEVKFYGDTDMPRSYKSWLTILKNGTEVEKKAIVVNDPLTYNGITFYQSSFGTMQENLGRGIVMLRLVSKDGKSEDFNTRLGGSFTIPGTGIEGRITDFSPALTVDQSGKPFTYDQNMVNPAIFVEFSAPGGKHYSGWIFKRFPQTWNLPGGSKAEFVDYWGVQYTGLQVRKDPGQTIVYIGCFILAFGLFVSFFMSHRRIWMHISEEKGGTRILIGASAHRNRAAFEKKIDKLAKALGSGQKGGS